MRTKLFLVGAICIALFLGSTSRSAHASFARVPVQHIQTVDEALKLCSAPQAWDRRIAVRGYFRNGPETAGPVAILGALFDSDAAPLDAALPWKLTTYHGLTFFISNRDPLLQNSLLDQAASEIAPHKRLIISGLLHCLGPQSFLQPKQLRIAGSPWPLHPVPVLKQILTVHSALKLCTKHPTKRFTVTILGFFARGLDFGPDNIVLGALFDHPVDGLDVANNYGWVPLHGLRTVIPGSVVRAGKVDDRQNVVAVGRLHCGNVVVASLVVRSIAPALAPLLTGNEK